MTTNPFADLVPAAAPHAAPQPPRLTDYMVGGHFDQLGYQAAIRNWSQSHVAGGIQHYRGAAGTPAGLPASVPPTALPPAAPPGALPPAATAPAASAVSPQQAMQDFANSAGMQFQLSQGANAINNLYAAKGALQSGSAMKAIQDYGQQTALQNYFMPYMNMVGGVAAQGLAAGQAVAGVGSNYASNATGINSNLATATTGINSNLANAATNINGQLGNVLQSGANSASNAAIARGQATSGMWGNIGSALGTLGSSFAPRPSTGGYIPGRGY